MGLRLFFLPNFLGATFIQGARFISDSRVVYILTFYWIHNKELIRTGPLYPCLGNILQCIFMAAEIKIYFLKVRGFGAHSCRSTHFNCHQGADPFFNIDWVIHRFYPLNGICTQKYHFWPKNDGEKWYRKIYFEIPPWGKIGSCFYYSIYDFGHFYEVWESK